ncbi:hypothetical protein ACVDG3_18755 [Meridianimarinicoccus sp. RP-17]|uniref:hypothetical protein n=1 Tax=Meridianimarinicoccus zhengii TaxID=2056810 RepID=UPI000DAF11E4|nr:hypothetical protein [Phycocomes zhengii]
MYSLHQSALDTYTIGSIARVTCHDWGYVADLSVTGPNGADRTVRLDVEKVLPHLPVDILHAEFVDTDSTARADDALALVAAHFTTVEAALEAALREA